MIFMVSLSPVFKLSKVARNALALSQALSTDKITIIDFQMTYNRLKLSGRINVLPDLFPRRKWSDQKYRRLTDHCDTAACEYSDSWNLFFSFSFLFLTAASSRNREVGFPCKGMEIWPRRSEFHARNAWISDQVHVIPTDKREQQFLNLHILPRNQF